nr:MAG: alpha/beta hydrolase [Hyphomicrobiales bacterium]
MQFDPFIRALFEQLPKLADLQVWKLSTEKARAEFKKLCTLADQKMAPIGRIEDIEAPGPDGAIPLRVYTPVASGGTALPTLVYFHGGGFVLGDLDCFDSVCRALADSSSCRIISVDYRLAPEHPFPAAVNDCFAALKWIEANASSLGVDPNRVAVGGDSAGGNLAAVVSQLAKANNGPHIAFQLLIYPITVLRPDSPSSFAFSPTILRAPAINWFYSQYVPDETEDHSGDPLLSPLKAEDLSGLPPAYIVTAGFDPLRDEGLAYADKLKAAGVKVRHIDYPSMIHGFFSMPGLIPLAGEALNAAGHALRDGLA